MKLVKMSLAAAVLLGASAFAIDNVKVSGDAKLYYYTDNKDSANINKAGDLFSQGNSAADTALRLSVTGDLTKGVSFGMTGYAVSALGLENNLVANTWTGAHTVGAGVNEKSWMGEMWLASTMGKTTAKIGRMELDTPLAFSEKWSVVPNTFEAAVLINQDLPDTTLVGAWVGRGNGVNAVAVDGASANLGNSTNNHTAGSLGIDGYMGDGAAFGTFASRGAYAAALVNNSFKPLTFQAWYYNVVDIADAYWLQADINCQLVKGLTIGAQYADMSPKGTLDTVQDSKAYAFKLGYSADALKVSAAFSQTDEDGTLNVANVGTNNMVTAQSKLYTESYWNYGYVGAPDTKAYNVTAEYDAKVAKLGAYYTHTSTGAQLQQDAVLTTLGLGAIRANVKMTEIALSATKSFGPLDATLAYVSTDADDQNQDANNDGQRYDSVIAMLQLNF